MKNTIDLDTKVKTELSIQKDAEEYVVGSTINNVFIRVPEEAIKVITHLNGQLTIREVSTLVKQKYSYDIDVLDFIRDLLDLDLILEINGEKVLVETEKKENTLVFFFSSILFSKFTNYIYTIMFLSSLVILVINTDLIPSYEDILIYNSPGLSLLSLTFFTWALTIFHESGHYFATKKLGIPVKFRLSLRLYWVVVEADVSGLWSVPRKERYVPYLAGMAFDGLILFVCLITRILFPNIFPDILALLTLLVTLTFGFHCLIFLRTDIYYVIMNILNVPSLHEYTRDYFKSFYNRSCVNPLKTLSKKENIYIKSYTVIYLFGSIAALIFLALYSIPSALLILNNTLFQLTNTPLGSYSFYDGLITFSIILLNSGIWIYSAISKYNISSFRSPSKGI